jgi:hypothetical protein
MIVRGGFFQPIGARKESKREANELVISLTILGLRSMSWNLSNEGNYVN